MIQYDKDGVTLFYIDTNGKRVSHYFMEGTPYSDMLDIRSAQLSAMAENTAAVNDYNQKLANVQLNVDAGRGAGLAAPTKPLQKIVSDTGVVSSAPFDPPLADLIVPVTVPSTVNAPGPVVNRSIPPTSAATDTANKQTAIMYNMILAMFRKMFPDA
jgi:hypothetical protein